MNKRYRLLDSARATLILMSVVGTIALADGPAPDAPTGATKEMRDKMALMHEQMATCLRSDKPIADCQSEMRKSCQETLGTQGCHMMSMGKHSRGMRQPVNTTDKPKS